MEYQYIQMVDDDNNSNDDDEKCWSVSLICLLSRNYLNKLREA